MKFFTLQNPLSRVFSPFGLGRISQNSQLEEPAPAPVSYENKLFVYTGSLDNDDELTETVIDIGTRPQRFAIAARAQEIPQPVAPSTEREEQAAPFFGEPAIA